MNALRGDRGDDTVSGVILFGVLLLIIWAVLQTVIVFLGRGIALDAARDGVNAARLPPVDTTAAADRARTYTKRAAGSWLSNVEVAAGDDGQNVSVTVTADAVSLVPGVRFTISQTSSGPIEQITP